MFQFYSITCKCELISETWKALITLNCCYSLITLNESLSKISLKWEYNVCHWFKAIIKWSLKVWYLIALLKLSGHGGIWAHMKAIKIIMENFQRQSLRRSRHTVHNCINVPCRVNATLLNDLSRIPVHRQADCEVKGCKISWQLVPNQGHNVY